MARSGALTCSRTRHTDAQSFRGSALTGPITHATTVLPAKETPSGSALALCHEHVTVGCPGWQLSGTCVLVSGCVVGLEMNELCLRDRRVLAHRLENRFRHFAVQPDQRYRFCPSRRFAPS